MPRGVHYNHGFGYKRKVDEEKPRFTKEQKISINKRLDKLRKNILAELEYAGLYGSEYLVEANQRFWNILYYHGAHVAEYYRRFGADEFDKLKASDLKRVKKCGLETD